MNIFFFLPKPWYLTPVVKSLHHHPTCCNPPYFTFSSIHFHHLSIFLILYCCTNKQFCTATFQHHVSTVLPQNFSTTWVISSFPSNLLCHHLPPPQHSPALSPWIPTLHSCTMICLPSKLVPLHQFLHHHKYLMFFLLTILKVSPSTSRSFDFFIIVLSIYPQLPTQYPHTSFPPTKSTQYFLQSLDYT